MAKNIEIIVAGLTFALIVIAFIVGRKSGHGRGFGAGYEKGKRDQAEADQAQVAELHAVKVRNEWMSKSCELVMPANDFQALWNSSEYKGNGEVEGIVRVNLHRADKLQIKFSDCKHQSLGLASVAVEEQQ